MSINPQRNQAIREWVIEYLGARSAIAQSAEVIHRRVAEENDKTLTLTEVQDALIYLEAEGLVMFRREPTGPTKYWQATHAGAKFIDEKYSL